MWGRVGAGGVGPGVRVEAQSRSGRSPAPRLRGVSEGREESPQVPTEGREGVPTPTVAPVTLVAPGARGTLRDTTVGAGRAVRRSLL